VQIWEERMSLLNPKWNYATAEESRKPNYLRNKFLAIKREMAKAQKAADEEAEQKVTKLKRKQ